MPEKDRLSDLEFPLSGLEVAREFQEQTPGTTADTQNCRGINPDSLRNRGGSRAGLAKYVPTVIPADSTLSLVIQHLNVIVDPQAEALRQNFPTPDETWVPDPHNPGFFIPPGGWGNQPNPNADPNPIPGEDEDVQTTTGFGIAANLPDDTLTMTFADAVGTDTVVLVAVLTLQTSSLSIPGDPTSGIGDQTTTLTVKDGNGNNFTQVASYESYNNEAFQIAQVGNGVTYYRLSVWRRTAGATGGDEITVLPNPSDLSGSSDFVFIYGLGVAFPDVDPSNPVDGSASDSDDSAAADITNITTGSFATTAGGRAIAFFAAEGTEPTSVTPSSTNLANAFNTLRLYTSSASGANVNYSFNTDPLSALAAFGLGLKAAP